MAIADIVSYSHLSPADIETLGAELDAIRREIEHSRGARDARYIHRSIALQRALDVASRMAILLSPSRTGRWLGIGGLAASKCIENMELGHNIGHGQWDWMNDPEVHSATWEWDMVGLSSQWRYAHNYRHHVFTNVLGLDDDIGWDVLRVTRDQPWHWRHLFQPAQSLLLAATFEWGIALYGLAAAYKRTQDAENKATATTGFATKIGRQILKDYVIFPALAGRRWRQVLGAMAIANVLRNLWTHAVIVCGHFPDGAEKFTPESIEHETRSDWYLRQMLGSANIDAGPVLAFATGNLCYQIEHHLFPDLPSNRYREIAPRVRALCDKYDLPYTTGSVVRQFLLAQRTVLKMSLPDRLLTATSDDAPETASERRFGVDRLAVPGRGLRTALGTPPHS
ncbi:MAG: acyl-CoA desaturase [Mycobacterium sp.]